MDSTRKETDSPKQNFVKKFRRVPAEVLAALDTYFEPEDYQRASAALDSFIIGGWDPRFERYLTTFLPFSSKPFSEYQHLYGTATYYRIDLLTYGCVPLHAAALAGNLDAMRFLMNTPYRLNPATGIDDMASTAIHWAASNGQTEALRLFMSAPYHANPNLKHFNRGTALDLAIQRGHKETAMFLIDALGYLNPQEKDVLINSAPKALPKKIHFIWIGGAIPKNYLATIEKMTWLARKSAFEISLWTDNPTIIAKTFAIMHPHVDTDVFIPYLKIRNIQALNNEKMHSNPLYAEGKLRQFWHGVNRERVGLQNLAAASDLLRYEILRQEGGYYFDTDLRFHLTSKDKLIPDEPILGLKVHAEACSGEGFHDLNNDIIGALAGHEILENTIRVVLERYAYLDKTVVRDLKRVDREKNNSEGVTRRVKLDRGYHHFFHPNFKNAVPSGQTFLNSMTAMDLKRSSQISAPHNSSGRENSSARWILTIAASGPDAFHTALMLGKYYVKAYYASYCKSSAIPAEPLSCSRVDSSIASVNVESICDLTWFTRTHSKALELKPAKPQAFDDSSISPVINRVFGR